MRNSCVKAALQPPQVLPSVFPDDFISQLVSGTMKTGNLKSKSKAYLEETLRFQTAAVSPLPIDRAKLVVLGPHSGFFSFLSLLPFCKL